MLCTEPNLDLSDFATRLRVAMQASGKANQSELARAIGIKPQAIQYLLEPKNNATGSKYTAALAQILGVSSVWLATGEGEMLRQNVLLAPAFTIQSSGGPAKAASALTINQVLDRLGELLEKANSSTRDAVAQLLVRYAQDPAEGKRLAQAIELLLEP